MVHCNTYFVFWWLLSKILCDLSRKVVLRIFTRNDKDLQPVEMVFNYCKIFIKFHNFVENRSFKIPFDMIDYLKWQKHLKSCNFVFVNSLTLFTYGTKLNFKSTTFSTFSKFIRLEWWQKNLFLSDIYIYKINIFMYSPCIDTNL